MRAGREAGTIVAGIAACPRNQRGHFTGESGEDPTMEHLMDIRARVERHEYEVDAAKVAEAILERLRLGRALPPEKQDS